MDEYFGYCQGREGAQEIGEQEIDIKPRNSHHGAGNSVKRSLDDSVSISEQLSTIYKYSGNVMKTN